MISRTLSRPGRLILCRSRQRVQHIVAIIPDFLCYNKKVNLADLLRKSIDPQQLDWMRRIADDAAEFGFPMYLVGGSVRDLLLGHPIGDFDLAFEGNAISLMRSLARKYSGKLTVHEQFGTVRWRVPEPQVSNIEYLDLISTRKETYSHPGALPTVEKATIEDDLRRRDFSINAMAIRLDGEHFGELHDPLGGQTDLENRLIRALHSKSFLDDPTRMFRAVRYAIRYGFEIEAGTLSLINDEAKSILADLSGERIRHELDLIFEEQNPSVMLKKLADLELLKPVHLMLEDIRSQLPVIEEPDPGLGEFVLPDILSFRQTLGWVLYLMDSPAGDIQGLAERLVFPAMLTKTALAASALKKNLPTFQGWKPSQWTFHLDELPGLAVYAVYVVSKEQALHDYLAKWQHIKPHTTGNDLKKRSLEPGPRFGEILRRLRAAWLDGEVKTDEAEKNILDQLIQ